MSATVKSEFIETSKLKIEVETRGQGKPLLCLHGWPDSLRTWDRVADPLADKGYRVIVPSLRGYGRTSFLDSRARRSSQIVAMAKDAIELLDKLEIAKVTVLGHDWGGRAGYALAALFPERIEKLVALAGGYETGIKPGNHLSFEQAKAYWYQWFWNTERGREMLEHDRRGVCRFLWKEWAPNFDFTQDEFEKTAACWENPDWVAITLHSYRVRWGGAEEDPDYAELEAKWKAQPKITVPTFVLHGESDGASLVDSSKGQESLFANEYDRKTLRRVGHFVQRETPRDVLSLF